MKKKINIILIIVVLGLWGNVAYKALSQYFFSDEDTFAATTYNSKNDFVISEKDTFVLEPINRDPFLDKTLISNKETSVIKTVRSKISKPTTVKPVDKRPFPIINYYGYIKSKQKKDELILLKINGKLKRLRVDETFEGLKIKKVFNDSIVIVANGETKSFRKV